LAVNPLYCRKMAKAVENIFDMMLNMFRNYVIICYTSIKYKEEEN
jgi:hypothetical protein